MRVSGWSRWLNRWSIIGLSVLVGAAGMVYLLTEWGGRPSNGCVSCHRDGDPVHAAVDVDCTGCHFGDRIARTKEKAHRRLLAVPGGDLAGRLAGCLGCHADAARILLSPMARAGGIVATTRYVHGETDTTAGGAALSLPDTVANGTGPAARHLRQLCGRCHLAYPKSVTGDWNPETARDRKSVV